MTDDRNRDDIQAIITKVELLDTPRSAVEFIRQQITELNIRGSQVSEELIWLQNRYVDQCIYGSQAQFGPERDSEAARADNLSLQAA